jgi:hypothetical protein
MNIKQKFEKTKKKTAEYKPLLIGIGALVGTVAIGVYHARKITKEGFTIPTPESRDYDEVVILVTKEARDRISSDSSFDLKHVDRDLYSLSVNPED